MKLEFSRTQFSNLLIESVTARNIVYDMLCDSKQRDVIVEYRSEIIKRFAASKQKIAAIKWLREDLFNKQEDVPAFKKLGYDFNDRNYPPFNTMNEIMGLGAAKKFVEECF